LLEKIDSQLIVDQIKDQFFLTSLKTMLTPKELSRSRKIYCKDDKYSCGIFVREIEL
jgi:hypothetical protein